MPLLLQTPIAIPNSDLFVASRENFSIASVIYPEDVLLVQLHFYPRHCRVLKMHEVRFQEVLDYEKIVLRPSVTRARMYYDAFQSRFTADEVVKVYRFTRAYTN